MKRTRTDHRRDAIDWAQVLGPLQDRDARWGRDAWPELTAAVRAPSRRAVRLRPELDPQELPFATIAVPWFASARWLVDSTVRPGGFLGHAAGDYYVQDAGSLLAVALCEIRPGERVADVCAAPGGKATAIAEILQGSGWLLANEVIRSRVPVLEMAIQRAGYPNVSVAANDVAILGATLPAAFDCVLVDAPCSGQSLVGKQRQSMAAFSSAQIAHSAARQTRILEAAAHLVAPGGRLVYSTCTFSFMENEAVVSQFLENHPGWAIRQVEQFKQWEVPGFPGCYRLWPHLDDAAGTFVAQLVRNDQPPNGDFRGIDRSRAERGVGGGGRRAGRSKQANPVERLPGPPAVPWCTWSAEARTEGTWWVAHDSLWFVPSAAPVTPAAAGVSGFRVARRVANQWQPSYGCGRAARQLMDNWDAIELDDEMAVRYVRGESLQVNQARSGWHVVIWRGRILGWTKFSGGTAKNHFPKPLRQPAVVG